MFSLISVICQGFVCITFTPPKVYLSEMKCKEDALVLYQSVQGNTEREIINMTCYEWHDQV